MPRADNPAVGTMLCPSCGGSTGLTVTVKQKLGGRGPLYFVCDKINGPGCGATWTHGDPYREAVGPFPWPYDPIPASAPAVHVDDEKPAVKPLAKGEPKRKEQEADGGSFLSNW